MFKNVKRLVTKLLYLLFKVQLPLSKVCTIPYRWQIKLEPIKRCILTIFYNFFAEIGKVRGNLFQINGKKNDPLVLPDAAGTPVSLSEKVYVPLKDHPEVSFTKKLEMWQSKTRAWQGKQRTIFTLIL